MSGALPVSFCSSRNSSEQGRFGFGGSGRPKHVYEGTAGLPPHQTLSLSIMSHLVLRRLPMMIGPMLPLLGAPGNRQDAEAKSQKTDIGGKKNATVMGAVDYDDSPDGGERQQAERRAEAGRAARRSAQGHATHGTQWVTGRTGDTGWTGWTGWGAEGCQQNTQRLLAGWLSRRVLPATEPPPHRHGSAPPRAVTGR
ncbi:hypothetical protein BGZ61DRAFT_98534 [Ilyonectria robusta]|uniref:uncharacterized protein n=1 Tax=Ilyonectria robusta TaxID=1079257 RepID=UPI001E8EBE4A|nr:uncharacterized protein BGZ61DRAFT_98534 [Ilyonectria robusta]KAH8675001.1 hypothetical protein BGZ61DRAFT_98534 [Ilyonectria robusta]